MPNKVCLPNVLVTGTAGFIGFYMVKPLVDMGYRVIGLDVINDYYDVGLKYARLAETGINRDEIRYNQVIRSKSLPGYGFIKLDLTDSRSLEELFKNYRFETIIHLAAQAGVRYSLTHPHTYIESNIKGFLNILEACRRYGPNHLIYASSSSVYGLNTGMPFSVHDHVDHPISLYAVSKKSNELMAHTYAHLFQIPVTGLRFFTVYGPWGRPDMAIYMFTRSIIEGKPIEAYNDGQMERDFTYIDDIVEGICKMVGHPPAGNASWDPKRPDPSFSSAPHRLYNIGNNRPVKLMDFIRAIERHTGKKARINLCPIQPGDVVRTWADVSDLRRDFGYAPDTPIEKGVGLFVSWYRSYYRKDS